MISSLISQFFLAIYRTCEQTIVTLLFIDVTGGLKYTGEICPLNSFSVYLFFFLFFRCFCFCLSALVIKMHQTLTEYLIQRFSFKNNKWVKVWSTTVTTSFVAVKAYVRRGPCSLYIPSAISTGALYLLLEWLIDWVIINFSKNWKTRLA